MPVKDRINCVNAMLRNYAGQHRLLIDPSIHARRERAGAAKP